MTSQVEILGLSEEQNSNCELFMFFGGGLGGGGRVLWVFEFCSKSKKNFYFACLCNPKNIEFKTEKKKILKKEILEKYQQERKIQLINMPYEDTIFTQLLIIK